MSEDQLEQKRRRYEEGVRAIQETARKLTEVGRLLGLPNPRHVTNSTDRYSLVFRLDGEIVYLSHGELDRLPEMVSRTNFLCYEIRRLEEELARSS